MDRHQLLKIIPWAVLLGTFGAFWAFNLTGTSRSVMFQIENIFGAENAEKLKPAVVNAPSAKAVEPTIAATADSSEKKERDQVATISGSTPVKARIAIVIDDWGYNGSVLPLLFEIKSPITIAVLPNHRFSKSIAQEARRRDYQVLLHLPLESESHLAAEKDTLYCSMDEREVRQRLKVLLESIPGIGGVNNHQGSKATADMRFMSIVLSEINKEGLFFLDSRTAHKSICPKVAASIGIKFAQSDRVIDLPPALLQEKEYREYVLENLTRLSSLALKRGYAIGTGHDLKVTLAVLRTEIPKLEKKGIKFVFLSDLVK